MMLVQTSDTTSMLVFCTHHIVIDGVSLEFITKEFIQNYNHPDFLIKKQGIQFKDYSEWLFSDKNNNASLDFWEKYLKAYVIKETISADLNLAENLQNGAHFYDEFTKEETKALKQFAQEQKSTPHNIVISVLNALIYKISDHNDLVIGTVNSGRNVSDIDTMIGMFVKTLPLRVQLDKSMEFLQLLEQIQKNMLLMDTYQVFPSQLKKETLFDVLVTYQNPDFSFQDTIKMDSAELKYIPADTNYSRLPLLFNFFESNGNLKVSISYNNNKYEEITIEFLIATFKKIVSQIIEKPSLKLSEIEYPLIVTDNLEEIDFDFNF
jgi:surfactin family lipopeptide synthetase A